MFLPQSEADCPIISKRQVCHTLSANSASRSKAFIITGITIPGASGRVAIDSSQTVGNDVPVTFAFLYSTEAANIAAASTAISGIDTSVSRVCNAVTDSNSLVIATSDTARGILPGMFVSGDNILRGTKVTNVNYATKTLTLDKNITIEANEFLDFDVVPTNDNYANTGYVGDVKLLHCQLDPFDGSLLTSMNLTGYLLVNELVGSERAVLHLDDLVTVTNS